MAVVTIPVNVGTVEGDGTGDKARVAFQSLNTSIANIAALLDTIALGYIGQNLQTVTAYELVLADAGKIVGMDNAAANILTIPANSSVAFPVNTRIDVPQIGAGLTSIAIGGTDTLIGNVISRGQNEAMTLWKKSATVWHCFGGTT